VFGKDGLLYRLTFSKIVADLCTNYGDYEVRKLKIKRGKSLEPGEISSTGLYLTCTSKCGSLLRAQVDHRISELLCDGEHRVIFEGILDWPSGT
jgi:hypothetical protein